MLAAKSNRGKPHVARLMAMCALVIGLTAGFTIVRLRAGGAQSARASTRLSITTYYVSPSGDDLASGLSPAAAWRTVEKVNTTRFGPGDRILLEGSQTFESDVPVTLVTDGPGDPAFPITIDSYGSGKATLKVNRGNGIQINWIGGVDIRDINVVGAGAQSNNGDGIVFQSTADGPFRGRLSHVYIDHVEVSGFGDNGIVFWGEYANGFSDVRVTDCDVHDVARSGITVAGLSNAANHIYPHANIYIAGNSVHDVSGIPGIDSGSGISVSRTETATVEFNTVHDNGRLGGNVHGGPVGIWSYESSAILIQHNESYHNQSAGPADGGGFDLDGGSTDSTVQYNYSHDNDGPGYLLAQFPSADRYGNNTIRYNISENDGRKNSAGSIAFWNGGSGVRDVEISNNTVFSSSEADTPAPVVKFLSETKNVVLHNNVFVTRGVGPMLSVAAGQQGPTFRGNSYWTSGAPFLVEWVGSVYTSLADWRHATGQEMSGPFETGSWGDPGLESPGGGGTMGNAEALWELPGYRLLPNSALLADRPFWAWLAFPNSDVRDFYGNPVSSPGSAVGASQSTVTSPVNPQAFATPRPTQASSLETAISNNASAREATGLEAGLVAYYRMDEPSWSGISGEVHDSSNGNHAGTARNGAHIGPGKVQTGGVFDGKAALVDVEEDPSLELTSPMTVAAWVRLDTLPERMVDLVIKSHHLAPWQSYELLYDNSAQHFAFGIANSSGEYPESQGPGRVIPGTWYHVVGVYDGTSITTYVNGAPGAPVLYSGEPFRALGSLYIGDEGDGATDLPGTLDEVRIYNRALSAEDVAELTQ